ncbi:MAG: 2OG-Fe(II) oxygenase [Myxococcota bacterium]
MSQRFAARPDSSAEIRRRLAGLDWDQAERDLDERGYARLGARLSAAECRSLIRGYEKRESFRSFVDLARHRFGERGDYRYFANPLPPLVRGLRRWLYPGLARIANRWQEKLAAEARYPPRLSAFLGRCRAAGQSRPTPLLLHYAAGGYNCLHQDLYGEVAFPLQVVCLLSRPGIDFEGGDFLLTEQRPRAQSRGEAVALVRGELLAFPNRERPARGARGAYRVQVRHGVSRLHGGERFALGIIFHDAK